MHDQHATEYTTSVVQCGQHISAHMAGPQEQSAQKIQETSGVLFQVTMLFTVPGH